MMAAQRRGFIWALCAVVSLLACNTWATIIYDLEQIDAITWQYTYEISNDQQAGPVKAATIWFDPALYTGLTITSSPAIQAHWSEEILLSVPGLGNGYDIFGDAEGVEVGGKVKGFSVRFQWMEGGMPGPQPFHILDPVTFDTLFEGMTVPEPGSLALFLSALAMLRRTRLPAGRGRMY